MSITRNLLPFSISRQSQESVILVYKNGLSNDDGSFSDQENRETVKAFVVSLTPNAIKRLVEGGVTISEGCIVSIKYELAQSPDEVFFGSSRGRVVKYAIGDGVTILTVDLANMGYAR